jgi:uncharacterized protein
MTEIDHDESFFSDTALTPTDIAALFEAASSLWSLPWTAMATGGPMWVDIPALGLREGCAILLNAGVSVRGLVVFASVDDYKVMLEDGRRSTTTHNALYLTFDTARDLPHVKVDEVADNRWPLAHPDAYPSVTAVVDGDHRPPDRREVQLVTLAARALGSLAAQHVDALTEFGEHPIEHVYVDQAGHEATLKVPHPEVEIELDEDDAPMRAPVRPGVDNPYDLPIEQAEVARLTRTLGDSAVHRLMGISVALASVPAIVPPSAWVGEYLSEAKLANAKEASSLAEIVFRIQGAVVARVREAELEIDVNVPEAENVFACRAWARGYAAILKHVEPRHLEEQDIFDCSFAIEAVAELPERLEALDELREGDETREDVLNNYRDELADAAALLDEAWSDARLAAIKAEVARTQPIVNSAPKVGRNDPCTCGSGKKYKKCCGAAS